MCKQKLSFYVCYFIYATMFDPVDTGKLFVSENFNLHMHKAMLQLAIDACLLWCIFKVLTLIPEIIVIVLKAQ